MAFSKASPGAPLLCVTAGLISSTSPLMAPGKNRGIDMLGSDRATRCTTAEDHNQQHVQFGDHAYSMLPLTTLTPAPPTLPATRGKDVAHAHIKQYLRCHAGVGTAYDHGLGILGFRRPRKSSG